LLVWKSAANGGDFLKRGIGPAGSHQDVGEVEFSVGSSG